ncbi:MAG: hypothetical protein HXS48_09585 [Theionarchaea archaeon]|nr:hypothetical protein [Theionarchaea archaeon]
MQMNIACGQAPGMVSKGKPLGKNHKEIQSLVIESGDTRIQSEDSVKLTGWYYLSVLNVLKELERVGVVPSEVIVYTKHTFTEEA